MIRKIIRIDKSKCNGCGACASACHEGAIEMINGKAQLVREDYCDGLGDCLPVCPTSAISFEEREAPDYNEEVVQLSKQKTREATASCVCRGTQARAIRRDADCFSDRSPNIPSRLSQWPCQIKLVPSNAPYFDGADLLIAADCTAYAYGNFHNDFLRGRIALIGCPKLDATDYAEKLTEIIKINDIRSVRIVRMEVPCCSGIEHAARKAIQSSGKFIPWQVVTVSTDGKILE